jgi:LPS-assembly lipoprotein
VRVAALCALCLLLVALEGCGFRLRGSLGEFEAMPATHVRGSDPAVFDLRQFLRSGGTDVVDDPEQAGLIVTVDDVARSRRVLTVGTRGRVQEYELVYQIRFHAEDRDGVRLLDNQVITQTRNFDFDEADVIAKSNEEEFLFRDMQRNAVMQILRLLQALDFDPETAPGNGEIAR